MKNLNIIASTMAFCHFFCFATSSLAQSFDDSAFSLLEKQKNHVARIYKESTVHITIDPDEDEDVSNTPTAEVPADTDKIQAETPKTKVKKSKKPKAPSEKELDAASTAINELINDSNAYAEPRTLAEKQLRTDECVKYCGKGFVYERQGFKNEGKERICSKYPLKCGYNCTTGWDIKYLVAGSDYTCQTAIQKEEPYPFVGPMNAQVTITEFFDFNCVHCKNLTTTISNLIESNPHVKFIFKPVNFLNSKDLALLSLAANKDGKFLEFYTKIMRYNGRLNDFEIDQILQSIGLNSARIRSLAQSSELNDLLKQNMYDAHQKGVKGVPALFINDEQLQSHDERYIAKEIDKATKQ